MMAQKRPNGRLGLPPLKIDEPKAVRLTLPGPLAADLEDYRRAYMEAYGGEIELESLIPHMLAVQIHNDRSFRTWKSANSDSRPAEHA